MTKNITSDFPPPLGPADAQLNARTPSLDVVNRQVIPTDLTGQLDPGNATVHVILSGLSTDQTHLTPDLHTLHGTHVVPSSGVPAGQAIASDRTMYCTPSGSTDPTLTATKTGSTHLQSSSVTSTMTVLTHSTLLLNPLLTSGSVSAPTERQRTSTTPSFTCDTTTRRNRTVAFSSKSRISTTTTRMTDYH
ncbi:hypothetical protein HOY80DRAFT_1066467 [Tuber brumale]|nr:hypothetical protein HOY80DRAFT_1066467 [Tuber brumale]